MKRIVICMYLKSFVRYKCLILDTYYLDTLYLCEQRCEDLRLFFDAERGLSKNVWEILIYSICTNHLKLVRLEVLTVVSQDHSFQGSNVMWFVDRYQHCTKNKDICISRIFLQNIGTHVLDITSQKTMIFDCKFLSQVVTCYFVLFFLCLAEEVCCPYLNIRFELSHMFECWSSSRCYCAWSSVSWWYVRSHLLNLNRAEYKKMGVLAKLNKITWWINNVEISDISWNANSEKQVSFPCSEDMRRTPVNRRWHLSRFPTLYQLLLYATPAPLAYSY